MDGFDIPVQYKVEQLLFPAQLVLFGWTHRIQVTIANTIIFFEKDEEGQWRALVEPETLQHNKAIDIELLGAMAYSIDAILN
jgi:hypothetical protein